MAGISPQFQVRMKLQQKSFQHVGRDYEKLQGGGYRVGHQTYTRAHLPEPVEGRHNEKLKDSKNGMTRLRSVRGVLQHGVQDRPELMGKLAALEAKEEEVTWNDVRKANEVLQDLLANTEECSLWYERLVGTPPLPGAYETRMVLILISDSAFKNASDKKDG